MIQAHFYYKNALVAVKSINFPFDEQHKQTVMQWAMERKLNVENFDRVILLQEIDRTLYKTA